MSSRSLRVALGLLDRRGRLGFAFLAVATTVERGIFLVCALLLTRDDLRRLAALTVALVALYALRSFVRGSVRVRVQSRLHCRAATALLESDPLERGIPDGDPELVLGDGVHYGSSLLADRLPTLLGDGIAALAIAALVAVTQSARLLLWGAIALLLAMGGALVARRLTTRAEDRAWSAYRPVLDRMLFVMRGRLELVANGADSAFMTSFERSLVVFEKATLRSNRVAALGARLPVAAGAAGIGIAILLQGGLTFHTGSTLGDLAILGSVLPAFVGVAQNAHEVWLLMLRFRPMAGVLTLPRSRRGGEKPAPDDLSPVVFSSVSFRYPGASRDALRDVSVTFASGQPLVLSGPNGSGKSTLLRLLAGLGAPSAGTVTLGGSDGEELELGSWRSRIAYLPQQPHLPETMSVGEIVTLLAPTATPVDVRRALDRVGVLHALESRAPDEPLGVKIGQLSVGQRKRVALARVLLRDASIVLLDEPDANLDADGVAMVARIAHELARDRLVAIAAHTEAIVSSSGKHVRLAA